MRRAVAVDHEPRITLRDQMRAEMVRQLLGDAGDPDIPGDVAPKLALGQPELAKCAGNQPSVMVTGDEKRRTAGGVMFVNGGNIRGLEE